MPRRDWGLGKRPGSTASAAILSPSELFVVEDTQEDERFRRNPLCTDAPHIRFYAGAPLVTSEGQALGTLCVIDKKPRALTDKQNRLLLGLAEQTMAQLELQHSLKMLDQSKKHVGMLLTLPPSIATRLLSSPESIADACAASTVVFVDIVGFTALSQITPDDDPRHAATAARTALRFLDDVRLLNAQHALSLDVRIGMASGPVVAGVGGSLRFVYDIFGATVNLASRVESKGVPGKVFARSTVELLDAEEFRCQEEKVVRLKGIREKMSIYIVESIPSKMGHGVTSRVVESVEFDFKLLVNE